MLFETPHLRLSAESGIGTLWLDFPGDGPNRLDRARLRELDDAFRAVEANRSLQVLVIRSARSDGFCAGVCPEVLAGLAQPADRAAFSWYAQQVFDRLARLDAVTLAHIEGPCLGAGLELALACDHRLCVAGPTAHLGFPDGVACGGGSVRLRARLGRRGERLLASRRTLSGREAMAQGLVDLACCERRARLELRTILDRLERRPVKPRPPQDLVGLAAERRRFAATVFSPVVRPLSRPSGNPLPPFPETIGLFGDDVDAARLASEAALRGNRVVVSGNRSLVDAGIGDRRARGFVTPLEAEQARQRVRASETLEEFQKAGLVFVAAGHNPFRLASTVLPRVLVCVIRPSNGLATSTSHDSDDDASHPPLDVFPYPRRVVPVRFDDRQHILLFSSPRLDSDAAVTLAHWLAPLGREPVVVTEDITERSPEPRRMATTVACI